MKLFYFHEKKAGIPSWGENENLIDKKSTFSQIPKNPVFSTVEVSSPFSLNSKEKQLSIKLPTITTPAIEFTLTNFTFS
jgi:hypothetical protein